MVASYYFWQGTAVGAIHGEGTYFARDAKYSDDYACTLANGNKKQMLVAEVRCYKDSFKLIFMMIIRSSIYSIDFRFLMFCPPVIIHQSFASISS